MEIKGEEFIRKAQVQQERDELDEQLNKLEEIQTPIGQNDTIHNEPIDTELGNIMLDNSSSNQVNNKKKYLILGLILVILFLLTIIIIRLLSNDSKEDSFTSNKMNPIETKNLNENSNIEQNFQKIMNERIQKNTEKEEFNSENKIEEIEVQKEVVENNKPALNDNNLDQTIKTIEAEIKPKKQDIVKKVVKKAPKQTVKNLVKDISNNELKGYFVQIGAFSKKPTNLYLNKIQNANLKYKIHQVDVKGKLLNKVLIGPYSSRANAMRNIESIKKKLNLSSAYVLKF